MKRSTLQPLKSMLGQLKRSLTDFTSKEVPTEIQHMKEVFKKEEAKGYQFHQDAFNNDQTVRDWVLRNDYLEYQLPDNRNE